MAEYENEESDTEEMKIGETTVDVDDFAKVVQEKFEEAKDYRRDHEQHWLEAYDAYRGKYPSKISKAHELASERGIFVNQTRRKINSAKIKINTLLFEDGKVPFSITPSRKPRFYPPDIQAPPDRPDMLEDALIERSKQMEFKIRDILQRTNYNEEVQHSIHEMCLYGTGCTKGISLEHKNFPVYTTVKTPDQMVAVESFLEQELMPACKFVSIWNVFPSPEAINAEDADYVIQRSFLSKIQLKKLSKTVEGFIPGALDSVIEEEVGLAHGWDDSEHPQKNNETSATRLKKFEVLEFWGRLDGEDLEHHIPIESEDMPDSIPVVITVIGDKVVKIAENPFDDTLPFHFGTDTEQIYPGKQFRVKPGASVRDSFASVQIPDVTNGLLQVIQQLEREADLDSGQTSIGYGDQSPSQTKTATGMSILNSNANRQTADVVRSVSSMITKNISAVYRWLMVDSTDMSIKGDYETISTGYEQYVAKEVHNTQLINFLQVVGQMPEVKQYLKQEAFSRPLLRAFNMEPDKVLKTEEQVTQEMQAQQQAQQKQVQEQAEAQKQATQEAAQQQSQLASQQIQEQTQSNIALAQTKAILEEKQAVAQDQRNLEMQERLELIKQGNVLHPANLENNSVLLREQMEEEQAQADQQAMMEEQQMIQQQVQEQQAQQQMQQMQQPQGQQGPPQGQQGPPQGQMPEDPTQAGPAQERLQGGPSAQQIQQREFEANAPQ